MAEPATWSAATGLHVLVPGTMSRHRTRSQLSLCRRQREWRGNRSVLDAKTHIESRGPAKALILISGFQPRNRLPPLPASGVKNPAPVATGMNDLLGPASPDFWRTGAGREGNKVSIGGMSPVDMSAQSFHHKIRARLTNSA